MSGDSKHKGRTRSEKVAPAVPDAGENPAESMILPRIQGHVTWIWDIPADTVHFSPEWGELLCRRDKQVLGGSTEAWWPYMHEDDVAPFCDMARKIVEGSTTQYRTLFRIRRCDGTWGWFLSRGRVVAFEQGDPVQVAGALMDVSELHEDVKFQHGTFGAEPGHTVPEPSPDLILRMDENLSPLYASPRIARSMTRGQDFPFVRDATLPQGMKPEQPAFLQERIRRVFSDGTALREQVTFGTAYGHDVTGEYSFWPEYDERGVVTAVMVRFRDLTDQILAERRAELNEMRLEALYRLTQMDGAPREEVLRFVMDSLIRLTGSKDGFLFFPHSHPGNRGSVVWSAHCGAFSEHCPLPKDMLPQELFRMATGDDGEMCAVIKNGNSLHPVAASFGGRMNIMRYISAPVLDADKVVCIAGVYNKESDYREADLQQLEAFVSGAWLILRRHRFMRELQAAKEAAEHASRVKDQFLANISHELRTPLHGILSMLQLLELSLMTEEQRRYVETAGASGQTLVRIIADILDFSRIVSDKMCLRTEPFSLKAAVESVLPHFLIQAAEKGVAFGADFDEAIPPVLLGDAARIRQILFNIVGNALKFTDRGSIRVECALLASTRKDRVRIYLAVHDTGIGIAPEMQDYIFEEFTQVDNSSTRKYSGVGLGLSIVRRLVHLMGGSITIDSEAGSGTSVLCSFPLEVPGAFEDEVRAAGSESCSGKQLDILVAEDDAAGRFAIQRFLQRAGHRPVCAPNGRTALEALKLYPFDCLFTDIQMPGMDGMEVVHRIRENNLDDIVPSDEARSLVAAVIPGLYKQMLPVPADMPVVAVSAHVMSEDKERFMRAGMDFYLPKPLAMDELTRVLKAVAARCRSGRNADQF